MSNMPVKAGDVQSPLEGREEVMSTYVLALVIGIVAGLQSMTAPAVVSWAARLGWLHLEHTWLAFLGFAATPYILSVLAIGELIVGGYDFRVRLVRAIRGRDLPSGYVAKSEEESLQRGGRVRVEEFNVLADNAFSCHTRL